MGIRGEGDVLTRIVRIGRADVGSVVSRFAMGRCARLNAKRQTSNFKHQTTHARRSAFIWSLEFGVWRLALSRRQGHHPSEIQHHFQSRLAIHRRGKKYFGRVVKKAGHPRMSFQSPHSILYEKPSSFRFLPPFHCAACFHPRNPPPSVDLRGFDRITRRSGFAFGPRGQWNVDFARERHAQIGRAHV